MHGTRLSPLFFGLSSLLSINNVVAAPIPGILGLGEIDLSIVVDTLGLVVASDTVVDRRSPQTDLLGLGAIDLPIDTDILGLVADTDTIVDRRQLDLPIDTDTLGLIIDTDTVVGRRCLLGNSCGSSTALSIVTTLHGKVTTNLLNIGSLSSTTPAGGDCTDLTNAWNELIADVNESVALIGALTDVTLYETEAELAALGALTGVILVNTMNQVGTDLSLSNLDATLASVNTALVALVDGLNSSVGAALMPLITSTTASIKTSVTIGLSSNIFASLWALLTSCGC